MEAEGLLPLATWPVPRTSSLRWKTTSSCPYILARRFGKDVLLAHAAQIDAGFDVRVLADMIATLDRFTDSEIPVPDGSSAAELRAFYADWRSELAA
jgi:hypothetical protein